jgi:RNA polymerase sigma factor (sigma-70 family)
VTDSRSFEACVLPWLDAGYNLARWLLRDETAAEDAVQDAALRAFRYFASLRGNDARPWFLGIVRNACFSQLDAGHSQHEASGFEDAELEEFQHAAGMMAPDPGQALQQGRDSARIDTAIGALTPALREVIVLRELEGLDYAEIALIASIPIGTVMSRLSRGRVRLRALLSQAGVAE